MSPPAGTSDRLRQASRETVRALWSSHSWAATSHLVVGMVLGLVSLVAVPILAAVSVVLIPTVIGAAVSVALLLVLGRALTALQRSRFEAFLGVHLAPAPKNPGESVRGAVRTLRDPATWRQLGYHVFAGLYGVLAGLVVVAVWSTGFTLTPAIAYGPPWSGTGLAASTGLSVAGLVLLFAAPWVARVAAAADVAIARPLLGVDSTEELTRRVAALSESREGAVDAADTERRRIERDLHDGVQQRLTSLAVNLGIARTTLTDTPEAAREAIAAAHDETKLALADLRELVRGMHPAVLDDRGLDAALSGIAARSPVPVRLRVSVSRRAAREVEAVAYFLVSEALTNATNHSGASQIDVSVERCEDRLHVAVRDDGHGGADPGLGTGLLGLSKRVRSVDGTLRIASPLGGPTEVVAEMPCAL